MAEKEFSVKENGEAKQDEKKGNVRSAVDQHFKKTDDTKSVDNKKPDCEIMPELTVHNRRY